MELLLPHPSNSSPLTVLGFLDRAASVYGDSPSLVHATTTHTWSETHSRCLRVASTLSSSSLGINRGQVVSVIGHNVPSVYELQFAVPMSGAVLNNINPRLDAHALSVVLRHSESKLVFVDHQSSSLVLEAVSFLPKNEKPRLVLLQDDSNTSDIANMSTSSSADVDFLDTYEGVMERGDSEFKWVRPNNEWNPMVLNYTSGTTSSPKGVVLSHRAVFMSTVNSLLYWSMPNRPVYLWTLPMFHANGWGYTWATAAVGATNICVRRVDAPTIFELIDKHQVTHMCAAPMVLNMLTNYPARKQLNRPVQVMTAGAPPPATVISSAENLGFNVSHGYGLTETGGLVVTCAWKPEWDGLGQDERAKLKSRQGIRTAVFAEADVLDTLTGKSVKRDGVTVGEIVFRGGSVMLGYYKDPEGTAGCMRGDGWFYTGDIGVMHPDGYLEVKDRSKDVIICGGENISSTEVETVLYTNQAVKEAAVVAKPDKMWGETPCAFVSLKCGDDGGAVTEREIREFCKKKLPKYMVPRNVVFMEELPKTSTGKIQKFLLRQMAKSLP
ncbi:putative acyl-activating enzyme 4 [Raphanus sativus]|uniref:Probable acyl-activating enzyme 4 n=1 Tax=Raphanus sativus TaxID=3726 RepID=A0A6J0MIG5_RAPSA|nr:probable acyl-activating enzyme 4 [Raphanus sativus]KAJ4909176.1 putative acyl-activating enzyme 4 [Raphanus sativus]